MAAAVPYTAAVLAETGQTAAPIGQLVPAAFVQSAPDGRPVDTLLDEPPIWARTHIRDGATVNRALEQAGHALTALSLTILADTRRSVYGADIIQRPAVAGYVRMLNPPSCDRCVVLAGKWFRWNEGFLRHPRCDCQHIPASENVGGDLRTDPYAYFNSLTAEAQEKTFGRIEARAIRDGGDIYRVVNLRGRGLATAKGNMRFGTPSRMTVDDIYKVAGTRRNAIRMLEREGYITGPQTAGGNIIGRYRERFDDLASTPRAGSARARVLEARRTGVRDPLDRATMTVAERRLFDANYRYRYARRHGHLPRSIGPNSADYAAGARGARATAADIAELENTLLAELADARGVQMSRLVDALGLDDTLRADLMFERVEAQMLARFQTATRTQ